MARGGMVMVRVFEDGWIGDRRSEMGVDFHKKFRVRRWWGCGVEGVVFVSCESAIVVAMGGRSVVGMDVRRWVKGFIRIVKMATIRIVGMRKG